MVAAAIMGCMAVSTGAEEAPSLAAPIIVQNLRAAVASGKSSKPKNLHPLPYPNNDQHPYVDQLGSIQKAIESHQKEMEELQEHLSAAQEHNRRLMMAQRLAHAMVSLHQSEKVLSVIDDRVVKMKKTIKKIGEDAEDISRQRDDMKKDLVDAMDGDDDKLKDIKKKLQKLDSVLQALCSKREETAGVVGEWREFVDGLRSAHGLPPRNGGDGPLAIPVLPKPPTAKEEQEEEQQEEEAEAESVKGGPTASEESGGELRKTPLIEVKPKADASEDLNVSDITAKPHEIAATQASIDELLQVHLPKVVGTRSRFAGVRKNRHVDE